MSFANEAGWDRIARVALGIVLLYLGWAEVVITAPTLVVHAADDHLAPYEYTSEAAIRIPGARLVTMDSGGHLSSNLKHRYVRPQPPSSKRWLHALADGSNESWDGYHASLR